MNEELIALLRQLLGHAHQMMLDTTGEFEVAPESTDAFLTADLPIGSYFYFAQAISAMSPAGPRESCLSTNHDAYNWGKLFPHEGISSGLGARKAAADMRSGGEWDHDSTERLRAVVDCFFTVVKEKTNVRSMSNLKMPLFFRPEPNSNGPLLPFGAALVLFLLLYHARDVTEMEIGSARININPGGYPPSSSLVRGFREIASRELGEGAGPFMRFVHEHMAVLFSVSLAARPPAANIDGSSAPFPPSHSLESQLHSFTLFRHRVVFRMEHAFRFYYTWWAMCDGV